MDYFYFYSEIYRVLEERTPVLFDCGGLCSSACCTNNGKGMLLFPFEEKYLETITGDFFIKDSEIDIDGYMVKLLFCNGSCDRRTRPLSCRIFPLFPYTEKNGGINVRFDPRARSICPLLLTDLDGIYIGGLFRLMVYKAAVLLSMDPLIKDFMIKMTNELRSLDMFFK
ncbi:MAG: hypothetical protein R3232_04120 [Clostridia bacterium]|nr:hypothetical protein [Clostridia bacterium]